MIPYSPNLIVLISPRISYQS